MTAIRTRFAPSPTGFLHIGSVRTALFSFLYARNQEGEFILRIEDTDRERSKPEFEKAIFDDLAWLGLSHDGPVVRQSERAPLYRKYADQLIGEGKAERIDEATPAVKFIVPKKNMVVHDLVHGDVNFDTKLFEDVIIVKSDGMPTYNFACVVDDHEQAITHIIRGDDHLSNTPRQWLLYEALGWRPPKAAHIPLITGSDRQPLSKRHGPVSIDQYRKEGYLPGGLLNYLALLGWSPGGNQEYILVSDMIRKFQLKSVGKTSAMFDDGKCAWLNGQHVKKLDSKAFLDALDRFLEAGYQIPGSIERPYVRAVALLFKDRILTFKDLLSKASCCFEEDVTIDPAAREEWLRPVSIERLKRYAEELSRLGNFDDESETEVLLRKLAEEEGVMPADYVHPTRVAITGSKVSPGLFQMMKVLGKERVLKRLHAAVAEHGEVKG